MSPDTLDPPERRTALETCPPDSRGPLRAAKDALRRTVLERRAAQAPELLAQWSRSVRSRLEGLALWQSCRFPCIYISAKPGEVDTHGLIRGALESGKRVCVPLTHPGDPELEIIEITHLDPLVPGPFGLLDPAQENRKSLIAPAWDLVLAPGLAFDRLGHRIGFGRGYYDRLLRRRRVAAAALAFSFQIMPEFAVSPEDIDMDYVVTEQEVVHVCRNRVTP
ncbi:5-formyltetrahydrofolate cyclo-ligase [bacterium]|nr:5-formyltetrahydrofolate cyclo-ligase [bacterium]